MTHISKEDAVALAKKCGSSTTSVPLIAGGLEDLHHLFEHEIQTLCIAAIEDYLSKREPLSKEQASELWEQHKIELWGGKFGINPIVFTRLVEQAHGIGVKP